MFPSFTTTGLIIYLTLAVTTFTLVGLVAVWSGLGRGHWFIRLAVATAVVALPLTIPAYELVIIFFVQSFFTILPLLILRKIRRRPDAVSENPQVPIVLRRSQFYLRDLLLLTVLVALVSAIFAQVPQEAWAEWFSPTLYSLGFACWTLSGAWIALGRARWWLRLIVIPFCIPALPLVVFLGLIRLARKPSIEQKNFCSLPKFAPAAATLLALLMLIPPGYFYYILLTPKPIPKTTLPNPNGYEELIQAAKPFMNTLVPSDNNPPLPIKPFVVKYRSEIDKAHAALQHPSRVPLRYEQSDIDTDVFSCFRQLARVFDDEAKLARDEGRTTDAQKIYLDEFRLADAMSQGGLIINLLAGSPLDDFGVSGLSRIRNSLSSDQCKEIIDALQKIDVRREPLKNFWERDEIWDENAFHHWYAQLYVYFLRRERDSFKSGVELIFKKNQTSLRLLIAELAVCGYRQEHEKLPASLDELVPKFFSAVPLDPFSGKPLIYRRTQDSYLLYSIGPDGKDDGGRPASANTQWQGDLLLEKAQENGG
jgi:hypothetical protein